jgi:hypothetical protein
VADNESCGLTANCLRGGRCKARLPCRAEGRTIKGAKSTREPPRAAIAHPAAHPAAHAAAHPAACVATPSKPPPQWGF